MNDKNAFGSKLLPNVYKIIDSITNLTFKKKLFLKYFFQKNYFELPNIKNNLCIIIVMIS